MKWIHGKQKARIGMKKRPSKINPKRETRPAKRRQALSVLSVSIRVSPSHFIRRSLQILVRNFYVKNTEISAIFTLKIRESPQFLRRNRIWRLPAEQRRATNQADRSFITVVNNHCTQNRGYTDTFWTGFGLFNRHC